MKSAIGIVSGIVSLIFVGMARLITSDVPIHTGYKSGSAGDAISKGIASGLTKYLAIILALGAIIFAGIGILTALFSLGKKPNSPVKAVIGMILCAVAIYYGILVFRSITR